MELAGGVAGGRSGHGSGHLKEARLSSGRISASASCPESREARRRAASNRVNKSYLICLNTHWFIPEHAPG